ncbi:Arsenical-resistance protein 3 [Castilleja foliolosa]|uniref:Arsenical-resistance protein 3 n=1 Tax=Castilleja foliolosa TaxID=1961234 RepID=A0ABD3DGM0_9LAMI
MATFPAYSRVKTWPGKRTDVNSMNEDYTEIELIGRDRPGLLSEIFTVLGSLHFNVAAAEMWTHTGRSCASSTSTTTRTTAW